MMFRRFAPHVLVACSLVLAACQAKGGASDSDVEDAGTGATGDASTEGDGGAADTNRDASGDDRGADGEASDVEPEDERPDPGPLCFDPDGDGYGDQCALGPDCNDENPDTNPGAEERCGDNADNNCNGEADEGCPCVEGFSRGCYEGPDGTRNVGVCRTGTQVCEGGEWTACTNRVPREELCDGNDDDCDGEVDEGLTNACGECGAVGLERCGDNLDNDCNGAIDDLEECTCDGRENQPCYSGPPRTLGFGTCSGGFTECQDDQIVACVGEILPVEEICDGLDNDCDGETDEGLANACGVCGAEEPVEVCDGVDNDCDGEIDELLLNLCGRCGPLDQDEICGDGVDNNCDGAVDEGCSCTDGDAACWPGVAAQRGVGECRDGTRTCDATGEFWEECSGFVLPQPEVCDGLDNDCDGETDEGDDGCSVCRTDIEICDGLDNDCDGQRDEFLRNACGQCFEDVEPEEECGAVCCDGIDNDCDGFIDEGLVNACGTCDGACDERVWGETVASWDEGELRGVDIAEDTFLRLGATFSGLPYLWVANSGEATVSQINTADAIEVARYPVGSSPSRTAVDFDGNVYVANRAFSAQGTVSRVDVSECVADECVRYTAPVGVSDAVPRGIAIDADGFPWVGTYNDQTLRRLDPATGLVLREVDVGHRVYGIAIDAEGWIWFSNLEVPELTGGRLGAYDPERDVVVGTWEIPGCSNPYGIAIDADGAIYLGNYTCSEVLVRFDRATETFETFEIDNITQARGVAVDADGMVWLAGYGTNRVARFDPATREVVGTYPVCDGPIGVGVAEDRHVWVPCYNSDDVVRLDYSGELISVVEVGRNPYSYSDLTGFQLRNFTSRRGVWVVQFDCGFAGCTYDELGWDGAVPDGTDAALRARVSNDAEEWTAWAGPFDQSPVSLAGLPAGQYIEIELTIRTSDRSLTPAIDTVTLGWARP